MLNWALIDLFASVPYCSRILHPLERLAPLNISNGPWELGRGSGAGSCFFFCRRRSFSLITFNSVTKLKVLLLKTKSEEVDFGGSKYWQSSRLKDRRLMIKEEGRILTVVVLVPSWQMKRNRDLNCICCFRACIQVQKIFIGTFTAIFAKIRQNLNSWTSLVP